MKITVNKSRKIVIVNRKKSRKRFGNLKILVLNHFTAFKPGVGTFWKKKVFYVPVPVPVKK